MKTETHECPCCRARVKGRAGQYAICPHCGWEDDPTQAQAPDFAGGANRLSLDAARRELAARQRERRILKRRRYGLGRKG